MFQRCHHETFADIEHGEGHNLSVPYACILLCDRSLSLKTWAFWRVSA